MNTEVDCAGAARGWGMGLAVWVCVLSLQPAFAGGAGDPVAAGSSAPPATAGAAPASAGLPAGITRGAAIEGITEYRLSNGLQILLYPDATKPTVTVNITYKVGSRMENYGETGMAHLLEHLLFKGSKGFPKPAEEFSKRGFHTNGSTFYDRTNYFSTFPSTDENLRWALAQQADAMVNSFIARKDLDSEMTVVRNEYEMGENEPTSVLFKRLTSLMFDWHNYGKETIGARSDIENVDIAHLQAFYRLYYQPDNAVLIVAGKFDEAKVLRWVTEFFGHIPRPERALPVLWTVEPVQDGERSVIVRRRGDVQAVFVGYHAPAALSADEAAVSADSDILGDTPNGRLHHELVEKGLAAQVFSWNMALHDSGMVFFGAIVKPGGSLEAARDRLIEVVESSFTANPPTEEELGRARRDAEVGDERALDDPQAFGVSLSESIADGDWRLFFTHREAMAAVKVPDVAAAAQRYLRRDNRSVGMFVPEDKPQRAQVDPPLSVEEVLKGFHPRETAQAGESFDPSQENIDARTRRARIGDLELALLPRRTHGQTVNVAMSFQFGDLASLRGRIFAAGPTVAMFDRGSDRFTRQQIADEMLRLKMTGGLFQFQTNRDQLPDALRFVASVLRAPTFPKDEFERFRDEAVTELKAAASEPEAIADDAIRSRFDSYPAEDPRHYFTIAEKLARIGTLQRDELLAYYRDFWGTARGQVAVVGDFDPEAIQALVQKEFGGWKSAAPYARILREPHPIPATRAFLPTPDKENAVCVGRMVLDLRDDDPDAMALFMVNEILGGGTFLHSRLADRVRQQEGLSYGIGSRLSVSGEDRAAAWSFFAIAAPQNVVKVEVAVREELARLLKDGIPKQEFDDARNGLLQNRLQSRTRDGALAGAWVHYLDLGRTFAFSKKQEDAIRALTPESAIEVARRYLDPSRLTVVIAGDPAKGAH